MFDFQENILSVSAPFLRRAGSLIFLSSKKAFVVFAFVAILFAVFINVAGCNSTKVFPPNTSVFPPNTSLPVSIFDPDGDGDSKGYSYFSHMRPATGNKVFVFDPNYHAWAAYNEMGVLANTGKASGGSLYCPDLGRPCTTIVGRYRVFSKGDADCISHTFPLETHGGAPMPYCMFFNESGYAVHGADTIPDDNATHGCVRVTPTAAKWLSETFMKVGTTVIVLPYANRSKDD